MGRQSQHTPIQITRHYSKAIPFKTCSTVWKINRISFFFLLPVRKKVAYNNLTLCFPEKNNEWKEYVIKNCYINLAINMMEFLYLPVLNKNKESISRLVKFNNHHILDRSFLLSKGTFFLSGHISNWELNAFAYPKVFNQSLKIIAKVQASKGLNGIINQYRTMSGNEIIQIGYSLRKVYEMINKNEIVCFLLDQSANPDYSVYVNFFGQRVATFSGPARIALKKRTGLILCYGIRNSDYKYIVNFESIEYGDLIESNDNNTEVLTQRIQSGLERIIRANPEQWLWFHKRFKHVRPADV
ncbi:MAG: lysophospholipid acyltransferase family protein [Ignavibacteria bacterium]